MIGASFIASGLVQDNSYNFIYIHSIVFDYLNLVAGYLNNLNLLMFLKKSDDKI